MSTRNIFITTHMRADADAIGSMCAVYGALKFNGCLPPAWGDKKKNIFWYGFGDSSALDNLKEGDEVGEVYMMLGDDVPSNLRWMPWANEILPLTEALKKHKTGEDYLIVVDCATKARCGLTQEIVSSFSFSVAIDHHETNERFCKLNYVDPSCASCTQTLFESLFMYNIEKSDIAENFGVDVATCLYAGLYTDSCRFSTNDCNAANEGHRVWRMASSLVVACNVDPEYVAQKIYGVVSKDEIKWLGYMYSNLEILTLENGLKLVKLVLHERCSFSLEVTDHTSSNLRNIDGCDMSYFIEPLPDGKCSRLSFRVNSDIVDANALMRDNFGGGGHRRAAGAVCEMSVAEMDAKIMNLLNKVR